MTVPPTHRERIKPENVPLSVEAFENMKAEARQMLANIHGFIIYPDPDDMLARHINMEAVNQLEPHLSELLECYQGGLEHMMFGCSANDIRGEHTHSLLETRQPKRLLDLQLNLTQSMAPVAKSIDAMQTLTDEEKMAAKMVYVNASAALQKGTEELAKNAGVRGSIHGRPR